MTTRYRDSHLINATHFLEDKKFDVSGEYSTNSHGNRIASLSIKGKYDSKISFGSYKEAQAMKELLDILLKRTRGRWHYPKPDGRRQTQPAQ